MCGSGQVVSGSGHETAHSVLPEGSELIEAREENGRAYVVLSEDVAQIAGIDLTLALHSVTLTLAQVDGIAMVALTWEGADAEQVYYLTPSDFAELDNK